MERKQSMFGLDMGLSNKKMTILATVAVMAVIAAILAVALPASAARYNPMYDDSDRYSRYDMRSEDGGQRRDYQEYDRYSDADRHRDRRSYEDRNFGREYPYSYDERPYRRGSEESYAGRYDAYSGDTRGDRGGYWDRSRRDRGGNTGRRRGMQRSEGRNLRLEPAGWIRVAYDFDEDNRADAYEYISLYELQKARKASRQRLDEEMSRKMARGESGRSREARGYYDRSRSGSQRSGSQQAGSQRLEQEREGRSGFETVEGTLKEKKTVSLAEMDERHVIVRINTRDGRTAKVDLGPEKKISDFNLKKGDRVKVWGTQGTINEKQMMIAHRIEADGRRISINRPQDRNLRDFAGTILATRKSTFGDRGPEHLMARIRMDDGTTTIVNLGPEQELRNRLNIEKGKTFSMLARPVNIDGKRALVAEVLRVGDQVIDIEWRQVRKQGQGSSQSQ